MTTPPQTAQEMPSSPAVEIATSRTGTGTRSRRFGRARLFGRDQGGATAIEFAILLTPFLGLLFAIIETALMFWTSQILDNATIQASRSLLTGDSHKLYTGSTAAKTQAFRQAICNDAPLLIDCGKLTIDVRSFTDFASASSGTAGRSAVSAGALSTTGFDYQQPQPGQIVVVRAVLEYQLFFTKWSSALANIGSGKRALVATTAFKTEPYLAPTS